MAIYTKRGDKGNTGLYKNDREERVGKDSTKIEAIGAVDELNSFLGIVVSVAEDTFIKVEIEQIQNNLFTIGSIMAGSDLRFTKTSTKRLEKHIDNLEGTLPVLKNFILPGGSKLASHLQYARSLARKAERKVVALGVIEEVKPQVLIYLNRLSDFVFMLARFTNSKENIIEVVWKGKK